MKDYFYRVNEEGNAQVFEKSGYVATKLNIGTVYPIDSNLSVMYEHPNGIVLSISDAEKLGIKSE
jgi:hypothetical protein